MPDLGTSQSAHSFRPEKVKKNLNSHLMVRPKKKGTIYPESSRTDTPSPPDFGTSRSRYSFSHSGIHI